MTTEQIMQLKKLQEQLSALQVCHDKLMRSDRWFPSSLMDKHQQSRTFELTLPMCVDLDDVYIIQDCIAGYLECRIDEIKIEIEKL